MTELKIAFVDDETSMHEMIQTILQGRPSPRPARLFTTEKEEQPVEEQEPSFRIDFFSEAEAAQRALEEAQREKRAYALLMTDIRMPGHDGTWLIRQARRIDPDIRIIVFTSYGDSTVKELAESAGGQDFIYLEKTVSPTVIKQAVNSELATWQALFSNRRLLERVPFTDEVRFQSPELVSGLAVDFSAQGIGVSDLPRQPKVGSPVQIELDAGRITIQGRVRWTKKEGSGFSAGVQFEEQDRRLLELAKRASGRQT